MDAPKKLPIGCDLLQVPPFDALLCAEAAAAAASSLPAAVVKS